MRPTLTSTFIISSTRLFGQIEIINLDRTDNSVAVFYMSNENLVKIRAAKGFADYSVSVSGASSSVVKLEKDLYQVKVSSIDTCTLIISRGKKVLVSKKYWTDIIPSPAQA